MRKKEFWQPAFVNKTAFFLIVLRNIFSGLRGSIFALGLKNIIDWLTNQHYETINFWIIVIAITYFLYDFSAYFFRNLTTSWSQDAKLFLQSKYITKFFLLPNIKTETIGTGKLQWILNTWTNSWSSVLNIWLWVFPGLVASIFASLVLIGQQIWILWVIVIILVFGASSYVASLWNKILATIKREKRENNLELGRQIVRMIMSKQEVLQAWNIDFEKSKIKSLIENFKKLEFQQSKKNILVFDLQSIIISCVKVWILIYWVYEIKNWRLSIWALSMMVMLISQIEWNILGLTQYISNLDNEMINVNRLQETFDSDEKIKWYESWKKYILKKWIIELKNVNYWYWKTQLIKDLDIVFEWGKTTWLVGLSGGWKSTIIKLISWYLQAQDWEVLIDWQPLPSDKNKDFLCLKSYYEYLWYLSQEPNIFDGSIRENLMYALKTNPSEEKINKALKDAKCDFVFELENGLETQIGEKWIKLSWGQRQRLAIAKIFLKNPKIILLDEPTSALDSVNENEISQALKKLFEWRTTITIAHRLQTIKSADKILFIENWKIVEQGTHSQLLEKNWKYREIVELQSN